MAYTTINDSTAYFQTKLFTGNSSTNAITFDGNTNMQPDWSWFKRRDGANGHSAFDSVRGVTKLISPNQTAAEQTVSDAVTSFNTNGFTLGSDSNNFINDDGLSYVAWNWKANGAGSANTDGTINSTVSVNQTAGFSIVKFTGSGANATVGHGLGAVPKMIIIKELNNATNWIVYHASTGNGKSLQLNTDAATDTDSTFWNSTTPTSSVFSLGSNGNVNGSSDNYIAYCFAEKTGYSKFGSYVGNGNANGTFVYTGFKPSWLMIKRYSTTGHWHIFDIKRNPYYPTSSSYGGMATRLMANLNSGDDLSQGGFEFLSNGLKMTTSWDQGNGNGNSFIYAAFGQSIVGSNNVPATAR